MTIKNKNEKQKVNIDGTEYDLDTLSNKAKSIIGFIQRLDKEVSELNFQLDKVKLAHRQVSEDLKKEIWLMIYTLLVIV